MGHSIDRFVLLHYTNAEHMKLMVNEAPRTAGGNSRLTKLSTQA